MTTWYVVLQFNWKNENEREIEETLDELLKR